MEIGALGRTDLKVSRLEAGLAEMFSETDRPDSLAGKGFAT
jgi:hypothetical protein